MIKRMQHPSLCKSKMFSVSKISTLRLLMRTCKPKLLMPQVWKWSRQWQLSDIAHLIQLQCSINESNVQIQFFSTETTQCLSANTTHGHDVTRMKRNRMDQRLQELDNLLWCRFYKTWVKKRMLCIDTLCYSTCHQMAIYWKLSNFQIHSLNCLMDWIAMSNQVSKSLG